MTTNHPAEFQAYLNREQHIARMIRQRIPKYGSKVALKDRSDGPWVSVTWKEMGDIADGLGRALISCGVEVGDRVGIFSQNRAAWTLADLAILSVRGVTVPVYPTNSAEETAYIVEDAGIKVLFVNDQEQYDKALEVLESSDVLQVLVAFSPTVTLKKGTESFSFSDFIGHDRDGAFQKECETRLNQAAPSDLYTLIYTSGTTGAPKGAMLTHENILASLYGTGYPMPVKPTDVSFAFLPLSHVFERSWTWFMLSRGAENHYCHDTRQVKEFFAEVRPHYMVSVPRVWEKIYATIQDGVQKAPNLKKNLFHWAIHTGGTYHGLINAKKQPDRLLSLKYTLADRLILSKIREVVGGRAKFFHAGGAALNPEINQFFVNAGIRLGVGYGLTEIFPICVCTPRDIGFGTSGKPIPLVSVRITDEGEIQAQSPSLMKGYWNRPDASAEAITPDGWFKTGDIGEVTDKGYVRVTDRLKEILITAGGKNISPQTIETAVKEDLYVEQAVAVGDGKPYISALVVPSFPMLDALAEVLGLQEVPRKKLVAHPEVMAFYRERIDHHTRHLGRVEQIKRFTLLPAEFTQAAGELTPTSKLKRKVILKRYAGTIEAMYAEPRKKAS
ncbi:AMP-dependent synthetase/ligase [Desulfoluna spongiiphila]|uniref:Long-chain acyl-CoA synthetase n=1 Tax=Desulfoluna spongiiphila TaxID=419481 RepID=A0A1G5HJR0_9BACT|nr:long-chain fatty acid--CoA ligase [Desulfoluna spongiiphila]SCY63921.1 long-chain acyl-CoA synthetase [Desulfoluna spongiiphila]